MSTITWIRKRSYVFLDDTIVDIEHIYCLDHVRRKFVDAYTIGLVKQAKPFINWIRWLYGRERLYKKCDYSSSTIKMMRNDKETNKVFFSTFHTVVQICRLMKVRVLKYLETFHEKYYEGCRDFQFNPWSVSPKVKRS